MLIAVNSEAGAISHEIATLVGIDIDEASAAVIDHVHNAGPSTLVKASNVRSPCL